ncbi:hypothetical protein [Pseudomonas aeruginosa]|uniref:hypothetical protein n=1 Tax=Pseudomonas aeruginosa TaxID=287 RepID=UPI003CFCBE81
MNMKSIYNTPGFSEELLLVCASLREVGLDNLADQFRAAVFDRSVVDQAIIALREQVKTFAGACGRQRALVVLRLAGQANSLPTPPAP